MRVKSVDLKKVGFDEREVDRSGSYMQVDSEVVKCGVKEPGVYVIPTKKAIECDEYRKYLWKALKEDPSLGDFSNGYFIITEPGKKAIFPVQTCLLIEDSNIQHVHNIIVVEEDSELTVVTGCSSVPRKGTHIGVSEFYVKKRGKLHFMMIHMWGEEVEVYPRTGVIVEEGATYVSDYVCFKPGAKIKAYPTIYVDRGGTVVVNSMVMVSETSNIDLGTRVYLKGKGARAEIVSRSVSFGGVSITRGHLVAEVPGVKGHLECKGLILKDGSIVSAIPELEARTRDVDLTHEAAVGKISEEEIEYLMARGFTPEEAQSIIVRGFLNVDVVNLPESLKEEIDKFLELTTEGI
ncbi:MAG: SufD family Fe-S cluster assembly protein [Thermosulfidibacteraceae bacterium]|jgi:Fe-S cluster assembly scaffold protein SufB